MSSPTRRPALVVGARGAVGAHVLTELIRLGVPVRASARRPEPGRFPAGVDVRTADLTDPSSLEAAFAGCGSVFLYANRAGVDGVVSSARAAGVDRIVLMSSGSVIHGPSRGNAITEEHREVEETLAASGLAVVPIRPLVLATNALNWSRSIAATGAIALYRPDARTAPVHEQDVAAVAVAALLGARDVSTMLTGPALIDQREQVTAIAAAVGRDVRIDELSRDDAVSQYRRFMSDGEAEAVLQFLDGAAAGESPATDEVQRILGRPPIGFDEWAAEHAPEFTSDR